MTNVQSFFPSCCIKQYAEPIFWVDLYTLFSLPSSPILPFFCILPDHVTNVQSFLPSFWVELYAIPFSASNFLSHLANWLRHTQRGAPDSTCACKKRYENVDCNWTQSAYMKMGQFLKMYKKFGKKTIFFLHSQRSHDHDHNSFEMQVPSQVQGGTGMWKWISSFYKIHVIREFF